MGIIGPEKEVEVRYIHVASTCDCHITRQNEQKFLNEIENLKRQLASANREIISLRRQRR